MIDGVADYLPTARGFSSYPPRVLDIPGADDEIAQHDSVIFNC
jgi:hypothetical protein